MILIAIIGCLLALAAVGMILVGTSEPKSSYDEPFPVRGAGIGLLLLAGGLILLSTFRVVDPGRVGVPVLFGDVKPTLSAGFHMVNPFMDVVELSVQTQEVTMSSGEDTESGPISAKSKDGQSLAIDITTQFHLDTEAAGDVYETIGVNYFNTLVLPAIREQVRNCAAQVNAVDAFTVRREDIAVCSLERITADVEERGVIIEDVKVRDVDPGERIRSAIEQKLEREQELAQKEFELQTAQRNAEIRITEAEGIAESQRIIDQTLSAEYLQFEYIQTLKELVDAPNNSTVILPFDQNLTPLIDVNNAPPPAAE